MIQSNNSDLEVSILPTLEGGSYYATLNGTLYMREGGGFFSFDPKYYKDILRAEFDILSYYPSAKIIRPYIDDTQKYCRVINALSDAIDKANSTPLKVVHELTITTFTANGEQLLSSIRVPLMTTRDLCTMHANLFEEGL